MYRFLILSFSLFLASCSGFQASDDPTPEMKTTSFQKAIDEQHERAEFAQWHDRYRFSAELPPTWRIEYVPSTDAFNIYDPDADADSILEKSQIFIRHFEADRFLTLSTVDILETNKTSVHGHDAVTYRIKKKDGVANFPGQPSWRSEEHSLIDIRYAPTGRTFFYVFSYHPNLDPDIFEEFIESLRFHNDRTSWTDPLLNIEERTVLKPFGILINQKSSPVQPERFEGFHTGIDYEILEEEEARDVPVFAVCGGPLRLKRIADGYGGVVVQECIRDNEIVTVVYGHVRLSSIMRTVGEYLVPGERLGVLGTGFSEETDGERKHLHFGIHKGSELELRGYALNRGMLNAWADPATL